VEGRKRTGYAVKKALFYEREKNILKALLSRIQSTSSGYSVSFEELGRICQKNNLTPDTPEAEEIKAVINKAVRACQAEFINLSITDNEVSWPDISLFSNRPIGFIIRRTLAELSEYMVSKSDHLGERKKLLNHDERKILTTLLPYITLTEKDFPDDTDILNRVNQLTVKMSIQELLDMSALDSSMNPKEIGRIIDEYKEWCADKFNADVYADEEYVYFSRLPKMRKCNAIALRWYLFETLPEAPETKDNKVPLNVFEKQMIETLIEEIEPETGEKPEKIYISRIHNRLSFLADADVFSEDIFITLLERIFTAYLEVRYWGLSHVPGDDFIAVYNAKEDPDRKNVKILLNFLRQQILGIRTSGASAQEPGLNVGSDGFEPPDASAEGADINLTKRQKEAVLNVLIGALMYRSPYYQAGFISFTDIVKQVEDKSNGKITVTDEQAKSFIEWVLHDNDELTGCWYKISSDRKGVKWVGKKNRWLLDENNNKKARKILVQVADAFKTLKRHDIISLPFQYSTSDDPRFKRRIFQEALQTAEARPFTISIARIETENIDGKKKRITRLVAQVQDDAARGAEFFIPPFGNLGGLTIFHDRIDATEASIKEKFGKRQVFVVVCDRNNDNNPAVSFKEEDTPQYKLGRILPELGRIKEQKNESKELFEIVFQKFRIHLNSIEGVDVLFRFNEHNVIPGFIPCSGLSDTIVDELKSIRNYAELREYERQLSGMIFPAVLTDVEHVKIQTDIGQTITRRLEPIFSIEEGLELQAKGKTINHPTAFGQAPQARINPGTTTEADRSP
ncbi:MAG: hypothetical protein ABII23_07345, partial [bacterium]